MILRETKYDISQLYQDDNLGMLDAGLDTLQQSTPAFPSPFVDVGIDPISIGSGELGSNLEMTAGKIRSGKTAFDNTQTGYILGLDGTTAKFYIGDTSQYLNWTGSALNIAGVLTAGQLHIPDQNTTANSFHVEADGDTFWGCTNTNFTSDNNNATAYVLKTGVAKFQSVTLTGSVVLDTISSGSLLSIQGWQYDGAFSSTDYNTVAWAGGTLRFEDGNTYSITGANTGNMTARTYIYFDKAASTTAFQTTTTASTAVGANKVLVAVAEDTTSGKAAEYQVFGGIGGFNKLLTADSITANSITTNEIAANTIVAGNIASGTITGTQISSLSISGKTLTADTGTIGGWTLGANSLTTGSGATTVGLDNTSTGGDDVRIYCGSATKASAPFRVTEGGALTATSATITGALTTGVGSSISGTYVDSLAVSKLTAGTIDSKSIALDSTTGDAEVRAGIATGDFANTGAAAGFIIGSDFSDSSKGKFYFGDASAYIKWDGATLTINGTTNDIGQFGGTGADGAYSRSSGTETIDAAGAKIVTKNYTTFSLTGGTYTISNPHAEGTILIIKTTGGFTHTGGTIDLDAMGGTGGSGGSIPSGDGSAGTIGTSIMLKNTPGGAGLGNSGSGGTGGSAGTFTDTDMLINGKMTKVRAGAGGGGGGGGDNIGGTGSAGTAGGRGGGALIVECRGALNFGASATITCDGANSSNSSNVAGGGTGGTGGGGGGGDVLIMYGGTLTANAGTITTTGGTAGTGGTTGSGGDQGGGGGAGGGGHAGVASNGSSNGGTSIGGSGGTGANGESLVVANTEFA